MVYEYMGGVDVADQYTPWCIPNTELNTELKLINKNIIHSKTIVAEFHYIISQFYSNLH